MSFWIKNTDNEPDAVLTMTLLGFVVILVKILLSNASITVNDNTYTAGNIDAAVIAALLAPTLGAYVARRYTDRKFKDSVTKLKYLPPEVEEQAEKVEDEEDEGEEEDDAGEPDAEDKK